MQQIQLKSWYKNDDDKFMLIKDLVCQVNSEENYFPLKKSIQVFKKSVLDIESNKNEYGCFDVRYHQIKDSTNIFVLKTWNAANGSNWSERYDDVIPFTEFLMILENDKSLIKRILHKIYTNNIS